LFATLGKFVTRYWAAVLAGWAGVLIAIVCVAPPISRLGGENDSTYLPGTVSQRAAEVIHTHFDRAAAMSVAAVIMERPEGLTGSPPAAGQAAALASDWGFVARLTAMLKERSGPSHWTVMSPADPSQTFLRSILVSAGGQAAIIKIDLPTGFASREAMAAVEWIQSAVQGAKPPAGLNVAVSGSASYGRDATRATETSLGRTTWIAAIAVVLILLVTYRALPVVGISMATVAAGVIVSVSIVAIGASHGWSVSVLVELFTIVMGFGAGVDFSLFFLSRYREELGKQDQGCGPAAVEKTRRNGASPGAQDTNKAQPDGAPTAYSLRSTPCQRRAAIVRVMAGIGPAIVASAGTVAAGLGLMYFAKFPAFHTAGPAVAISVVVACIASLTLTPALAYLIGSQAFWPRRLAITPGGMGRSQGVWDRIAAFVVRRCGKVFIFGLILLAPAAMLGWRQEVVYDTLADLPQTDQSVQGARMLQRHFSIGEMSPVQIVVQLDRPISEADWTAIALAVDRRLAQMPQVRQVRSIAHPLGVNGPHSITMSPQEVSMLMASDARQAAPARASGPSGQTGRLSRGGDASGPDAPQSDFPLLPEVGKLLGIPPGALAQRAHELADANRKFRSDVLPRYLGRERNAGLWEVALPWPPYANDAMNALAPLVQSVSDALKEAMPAVNVSAGTPAGASPRVMMAGDAALMRDLREVTNHDFWFVGVLAVATIVLIVTLLIRDLAVALFVMMATILTYGAALGLTSWAFHLFFGTLGPDWKVEFFLFVILLAVGQDYNLFMLTRIMEERRVQPLRPAVQTAIARTGSVISYCGMAMAATLSSLASSPLRLLQELGTAFFLGLVLDTFIVRPLMVPAFILVFGRMKRSNELRNA
jgi:RND superfamily putative drug exporter